MVSQAKRVGGKPFFFFLRYGKFIFGRIAYQLKTRKMKLKAGNRRGIKINCVGKRVWKD